MYISHVSILNFRALQSVSIPLNQFSVLLGENDVGKTSFLYALEAFFLSKKINDLDNFFKRNTTKNISISLMFMNTPNTPELESSKRADGSILVSKDFPFDKPPIIKAILDDGSKCDIDKKVLKNWFSSDNFHFIPVRRDLSVQFSMNKTALLGKTLRAQMKNVIERGDASESLQQIQDTLKASLQEPQETLEAYLQEQLHNLSIKLNFKDIEVDPVEGVKWTLSKGHFFPKLRCTFIVF